MDYGQLPITGVGALTFLGLSVTTPWLAALGAGSVVVGALLMRYFRPVRVDPTGRDH